MRRVTAAGGVRRYPKPMLEVRSTRLQVAVIPGPGVTSYSLYVDGITVTMGPSCRGEVACAGRCGDGSPHALLYSVSGTTGAALAIAVRCGERVVFGLRAEIVGDGGVCSRAGRAVFAL